MKTGMTINQNRKWVRWSGLGMASALMLGLSWGCSSAEGEPEHFEQGQVVQQSVGESPTEDEQRCGWHKHHPVWGWYLVKTGQLHKDKIKKEGLECRGYCPDLYICHDEPVFNSDDIVCRCFALPGGG